VRVQRVRPPRPDDHVIAGQPGGIEAAPRHAEQQQILQRRTGLPHGSAGDGMRAKIFFITFGRR
jgi:hypothetical protein